MIYGSGSARDRARAGRCGQDGIFKRRPSTRFRSLRNPETLEEPMSSVHGWMAVPEPNGPQTVLEGKRLRGPHQTRRVESWSRHEHRLAHFSSHVPDLVGLIGAPIAMERELMRHAFIETTMNVYGRAVVSDAKRQANSKIVRIAPRPVLSTK